jgi:hypothetical protein
MEAASATIRKQLSNYVLKKNGDRYLYSLPTHVLNDMTISTWKLNRQVDKKRVKKIAKSIVKTKRIVGIIYLADINNKLVCFDGNHRRLALEEVLPLSKTSDTEDVLVLIMWNSDTDEVVEEFNNINLAVSVSSIHTDNKISNANKVAISNYVTKLVFKYPAMTSSSVSCHRPKFNRDLLEQDLVDILQIHDNLSGEDLVFILKKLNKAYAAGTVKMDPLKPEFAVKCKQSGLWLFCEGRTINRKQVAKLKNIHF